VYHYLKKAKPLIGKIYYYKYRTRIKHKYGQLVQQNGF